MGFLKTGVVSKKYNTFFIWNIQEFPALELKIEIIQKHHMNKDKPYIKTSRIGVHLRYGTISIRDLV